MVNRLYQVFNVRTDEAALVGLMLLHSFFVGVPRIFAATSANTLFLDAYSAQLLPVIYVASAVLNPLVALFLAQLGRRLNFSRFLMLNLGLQVASLLAFRILFHEIDDRWPALAFSIWFEVLWVLTGLQFWSLAGRVFDIRQGKRLFALIGSGEVVAFMVIGIFGASIIGLFGVENLLLLAVLGVVVSMGLVAYITSNFEQTGQDDDPRSSSSSRRRGQRWYGRRYIQLIFGLAAVAYVVFFFVDNVFYTQVELQFDDTDALASFLIGFAAFSGFTNLIVRLFVSERVINTFGVRGGLGILPSVLIIGAVAIVAVDILGLPVELVFLMAVLFKLGDQVLRYSVSDAAMLILYQPLPNRDQIRSQSAVESIIEPVTGGLTGLLLLLLVNVLAFDSVALYAVVFVFAAIWLIFANSTSFAYREQVIDALRRKRLDGHTLSFEDAASIKILKERLESPRASEVVYAINTLDSIDFPGVENVLVDMLHKDDPRIQQDSLERIARRDVKRALSVVRELAHKGTDSHVRAAAIRTLAALDSADAFGELTALMQDRDPQAQEAAMVGLLRDGGIEGVLVAGNALIRMTRSTDPAERAFGAGVLGEVGVRDFYRPLIKLLRDDEIAVRRSALVAAGKVTNPRLWPQVIENLEQSGTRPAAVLALSNADEAVLTSFRMAFQKPETPQRTLMEIATIACRIESEAVAAFLLENVTHPNLNVRLSLLLALSEVGYVADTPEAIATARVRVHQSVEHATWALACIDAATRQEADFELFQRALRKEVDEAVTRAFYWLSFFHDRRIVLQALANFRDASRRNDAYTLEALDQMLEPDMKRLLFPLLEPLTETQRLTRLREIVSVPNILMEPTLRRIITQEGEPGWYDPWLRATAVHATTRFKGETMTRTLLDAAEDPDPMVAETAMWALFRIAPNMYRFLAQQLRDRESNAIPTTQIKLKETIGFLRKEEKDGRTMLLTVEKVIILKSVSIFTETPEEFLAQIAYALEEVDVDEGETFVTLGESADCMYVIVSGEVRVHVGERTVATLGDRDFVGELALLDEEPRSASITATKATRLLRLDRDDFYEVIHDYPEVSRGIMRVLSARLRAVLRDVQ